MGELGSDAWSYGVAVGSFDLGHLGVHLVGDGDAAESAVLEAEVVGVRSQDHDHGVVDGCGGVQAGGEFVGLLLGESVAVATSTATMTPQKIERPSTR
ncbi:hypothetical protein [Nonomuraea cavernae]|uniref:hypothetical protein n=1 Tax=Nonomuraea cavernae TaxID=2045107 RepID=UPI0033EC634A